MCLLISALFLCLTLEAVPLWCLLLLITVLLQIYKTLTQQIDANRCVNMMVRKAYLYIHVRCIHVRKVGMPERRCMIIACIHATKTVWWLEIVFMTMWYTTSCDNIVHI